MRARMRKPTTRRRERAVGGGEGFCDGDEVEEDTGECGGDRDVAPTGAVVEGRGQDRERGDAVEDDRDSEPEEGHKDRQCAMKALF
jgi:hypothetical protein